MGGWIGLCQQKRLVEGGGKTKPDRLQKGGRSEVGLLLASSMESSSEAGPGCKDPAFRARDIN